MSSPHGHETPVTEPEAPASDPGPAPRPCGCQARQEALNAAVPGLGDAVKVIADPIYERWLEMPALLKPDMKSLVWLAIGAFLVPRLLTMVR